MKRFWSAGVPSRASWLWLASGLGWALGTFLYSRAVVANDLQSQAIWDMADFLMSGTVAALIFVAAHMTRQMAPLSSRRWAIAGLGSACAALSALVWLWYGLSAGTAPPSPGLADVFSVLQYPLVASALIGTGLSYRGLVRTRGWAIGATAFSAVACSILWFTILRPALLVPRVVPVSAFVMAYYPLADVAAGIGPALFVLAVVSRVGGGVHRWPWMSVALGILVLTAGDLAFAVLTVNEMAGAAAAVGSSWVIGRMLIGFGALLAADVVRDLR